MNTQTKLIRQLVEVSNSLYKECRSNKFGDSFLTIQFRPLCQGTNITSLSFEVIVFDYLGNSVIIGRYNNLRIVIDNFRSLLEPSFVRSLMSLQKQFDNIIHG